eukprot:gb/GECG01009667.1/.p1 GENE.gb/GECG01009667.1/~~gb/GECG01009667.1/.p1  ORF type:complete len:606 (+),score=120.59 gb/GECG01009667.1/:1-1818(+)
MGGICSKGDSAATKHGNAPSTSSKAKNKPKLNKNELTILVIGLDNAGKTTLTYALKGDTEIDTVPTVGFNAPVRIERQGKRLCFYDLGGGARIRGVWTKYFHEVHGVIYVVDAADPFRFAESRDELLKTVEHPMVVGKPILVLANKQDKPEAVPDDQLISELQLQSLTLSRHNVFQCIARPAENSYELDSRVSDGLNWLVKAIKSNLDNLHTRMQRDAEAFMEKEKERKSEVARRLAEKRENEQKQQSATQDQNSIPCTVPTCENPASRRCQAAGWQAVCERCANLYESGEDAARVLSGRQGKQTVRETNDEHRAEQQHTYTQESEEKETDTENEMEQQETTAGVHAHEEEHSDEQTGSGEVGIQPRGMNSDAYNTVSEAICLSTHTAKEEESQEENEDGKAGSHANDDEGNDIDRPYSQEPVEELYGGEEQGGEEETERDIVEAQGNHVDNIDRPYSQEPVEELNGDDVEELTGSQGTVDNKVEESSTQNGDEQSKQQSQLWEEYQLDSTGHQEEGERHSTVEELQPEGTNENEQDRAEDTHKSNNNVNNHYSNNGESDSALRSLDNEEGEDANLEKDHRNEIEVENSGPPGLIASPVKQREED